MILLFLLLHTVAGFSLDQQNYQNITGEEDTQFGMSLVVAGDKVFVGAPREGAQLKGTVYSCNLKDLLSSKEKGTYSHLDICSAITLPDYPDPTKVNETGQGLGGAMALNADQTRLTVCAPRRIARSYSYCHQSTDTRFITNLRGVCYEVVVESGDVVRTIDWCKGNEWQLVTSTTGSAILSEIFQTTKTTTTCLQLRPPADIPGELILTYSNPSQTKTVRTSYTYENGVYRYTIDLLAAISKSMSFECVSDVVKIMWKKRDPSVLYFSCSGEKMTFDLGFDIPERLTGVQLGGYTDWWAEDFDVNARKAYQDLDKCMLGTAVQYRSGTDITVTAPGFGQSGGIFFGAVFFGGTSGPFQPGTQPVGLLGTTYSTMTHMGQTWDALTGKILDSSMKFMTQRGTVVILRDKEEIHRIDEEETLGQFGFATLFWGFGDILEIVISSPYSQVDGVYLCGRLEVHQLNSAQDLFVKKSTISGPCGGFGISITTIGDINEDGFLDIAVGVPYSQKIVIILGSATGLSDGISQIIQPEYPSESSLFGYSIAAGDLPDKGRAVLVSDMADNMVYVFRTLPIARLVNGITCNTTFNIDVDALFNCSICITVLDTILDQPVNVDVEPKIEISWNIKTPNITVLPNVLQKNLVIQPGEGCQNLKFGFPEGFNTRQLNLGDDIVIEFSTGYYDITSREVAIEPNGLESIEEITIDVIGRCGDVSCTADFGVVLVSSVISRSTNDSSLLRNETLYHGLGYENVTVWVNISTLSGIRLDEDIHVEHSLGLILQNDCWKLDDSAICSMPNEESLSLTFSVDAYLSNVVVIAVEVQSHANLDTDLTNNQINLTFDVVRVLSFESAVALEPTHISSYRLHSNSFRQRGILQDYGPPQDLKIQIRNTGVPRIEKIAVSVLYPVWANNTEYVYVGAISEAAEIFHCDVGTTNNVNYKNFVDMSKDEGDDDGSKEDGILTTVSCGDFWECVNLTCYIEGVSPGASRTVGLTITSFINPHKASMLSNLTLTINYTISVLDRDALMANRSVVGVVETFIEVLPPSVNPIWYMAGAVVGATVIMAVLVVVLHKCGFFNRNKDMERVLLKETENDEKSEE